MYLAKSTELYISKSKSLCTHIWKTILRQCYGLDMVSPPQVHVLQIVSNMRALRGGETVMRWGLVGGSQVMGTTIMNALMSVWRDWIKYWKTGFVSERIGCYLSLSCTCDSSIDAHFLFPLLHHDIISFKNER
jgi:hypothetical protein